MNGDRECEPHFEQRESERAVAGIVTFNPDLKRLEDNIRAVLSQVDKLIIVDNASENFPEIEALTRRFDKIHLSGSKQNLGLPKALNRIMSWAEASGKSWVLLLDQDSVSGPGLVAALVSSADGSEGILTPKIVDRNLHAMPSDLLLGNEALHAMTKDVDYCITSGSLCSVKAWRSVGGYDESMFIDFVDFDFCLRLRMAGLRIVNVASVQILHELGRAERHGKFVAYNYSAFRNYYMARDMLYYARKHRISPKELKVNQRGMVAMWAVLSRKAFIVASFENDKLRRISALGKGAV